MKIVLKIILTVFFILFSLVLAVSGTFKFQLLKTSFWENTFEAEGTYSALSQAVINNLENSVTSNGGKINDVAVFTEMATAENLKDLIGRNIENSLNFVNGKSVKMIVYLPVSRIPASLLPVKLGNTKSQIELGELLKETGVASLSASEIEQVRGLPKVNDFVFFGSVIILIAILLGEIALTENGKRLVFPGFSLVASAFVIFTGSKLLEILRSGPVQKLLTGGNLAGVIAGSMLPPVMTAVSKIWIIEGILLAIFGIVLFFIKKPYNHK